MRKLYFLVSILFTLATSAQDVPKIVFFKNDWKPANPRTATYLVEQKKLNDTAWEWNYYVAKGPRFLSLQFNDEHGKQRNGEYITYTKDGYVDSAGYYKNGKKNGRWNVMASNHRLLYKLEYKDGELISKKDSLQVNEESKRYYDSLKKTFADTTQIESEFPGGAKAWQRYLNKNLKYPEDAILNNVAGDVIVKFIVDQNGYVISAALHKSGEYYLDQEALRLILVSPQWVPAQQGGKKVKSYKMQPISFGLGRR